MYSTKILLDSISPGGRRLTTWELRYPRFIHSELMTHREFSRNSASSRAIPNVKLRQQVAEDPALPVWWGKNQSGMQAREELVYASLRSAKNQWLYARDLMLDASEKLANIGLHKQLCNRLLEPWMFITVIVSSTSFENFFHLRDHRDAQPEIAWVARDMRQKYRDSVPLKLQPGEWHLPMVSPEDWLETSPTVPRAAAASAFEHRLLAEQVKKLKKVAVGRVARVSYLTHDGRRDLSDDIALHDKLLAGAVTGDPLHMSPFEHVAQCLEDPDEPSGNFRGWKQYRKEFADEVRR